MARKRHTGAFVLGSLIGGLAGAALTLWKTPQSGAELRASLSGGGGTPSVATSGETAGGERHFSNPMLSFVEKAAAPIPGVELGKLAKDDPSAAAPVRTSAADARPPDSTFEPVEPEHGTAMASPDTAGTAASLGGTAVYRSGASVDSGEPVGQAAVNPSEEATHDATAGSEAPAASTEDLTSPTAGYAEQLQDERSTEPVTPGTVGFPDTGDRDDSVTDTDTAGYEAVNPSEEATHEPVEGSEAHAATTEELTHPTPEYAEQLQEERGADHVDDTPASFPEPPTRDETR